MLHDKFWGWACYSYSWKNSNLPQMVKKPNYFKFTSKVPDWFLFDNGIQEHPGKKCCQTTPLRAHVLDFHLSLCPCLFLCLCLSVSLGLSLHMCLLACLTLSLPFLNFWSNIYLVSSFSIPHDNRNYGVIRQADQKHFHTFSGERPYVFIIALRLV